MKESHRIRYNNELYKFILVSKSSANKDNIYIIKGLPEELFQ